MTVARHLDWDDCRNVRDLGGIRTAGGRQTRWGAVVRSDTPDNLTQAGWSALRAHGIRTKVAHEPTSRHGSRADRAVHDPGGRARGRVGLLHTSQGPWLGNVVARDVAVSSFSRLEVASAFEVAASVGGQPSLTLRVDDNLERHVEAGVSGDTLRIGLRRGTSVSDATLQATITAPSLVQVQGSGASRIRLQERVAADDLGVELSGASRLDGAAELGSMTAGLSGASELALSGRVRSMSASASGASRLALQELQVDSLEVDLSGASTAEVSVRRTISAGLSGASTLRYRGTPAFTRQETSGGSTITRVS